MQPLAQRTAKPARQWHRKPHLAPVKNFVGKIGFQCLLEDILAFMPMQLVGHGQSRYPFHELMIQQRDANLQRMRHAGAVDLGQDIADQIGLHIQVLDTG